MSTKAIREALTKLHSMLPVGETHLAVRALDELERIESAAKDVVGSVQLRVWRKYEAADTFESIAREAPHNHSDTNNRCLKDGKDCCYEEAP